VIFGLKINNLATVIEFKFLAFNHSQYPTLQVANLTFRWQIELDVAKAEEKLNAG
jgi:hypothetical protein